jgi:FdrA protein
MHNHTTQPPVTRSEIRPGAYYDSVILMQLQRSLAALPGVLDAGVVMATPANRELLASSDLLPSEAAAADSDDLLIVVKGESEAAAVAAMAQLDELLARRRSQVSQTFRPRSLESALKTLPQARWVMVSVPGRYAAAVAQQALDLDRHVFLYSDNVLVADEMTLKQTARAQGLLVMGPDCGTAIVNGTGLGFANRVRRGRIGLIGASGTGLQAVTSRIHQLGGGVSQAIGCGGRDLSAEVGAVTTHQALDLLRRDPETAVVVLISKPPAAEVVTDLLASAQAIAKPVVISFMGYPPPARRLGSLYFAATLSEAADLATQLSAGSQLPPANDRLPALDEQSPGAAPQAGLLRGLFSGGTLAYEALLALQAFLAPVYSNVPMTARQQLADPLRSQGHTILDLGADEFTQGRLHPMLDNELRLRRLRQEAAEPAVGLILLDVVLGDGAHPDPAAELAPAIAEVRQAAQADGRTLAVAAIVVGTDEDPQDLNGQVEKLAAAGTTVFTDTTAAVDFVRQQLPRSVSAPEAQVALDLLQGPLAAINVGLESFYESVRAQGATAVHVDWRPPAGGNEKLAALLNKMKRGAHHE